METLFNDLSRSNTEIRTNNIVALKENGFIEGGIYCTSGILYLRSLQTKTQLVFGRRCNVSGKRQKYFSLSRDFSNEPDAIKFFKENIENKLKSKSYEPKYNTNF